MRNDDTLTPKVFITCLIVVVGFSIWSFIQNFFTSPSIDFDSEGTSETVKIDGLSLIPGDKREYSFELRCRENGDYNVAVSIKERADGNLKNFVNVTVDLGDDRLYSGALSDMIEECKDKAVLLENRLIGKGKLDLVITYEMPLDVGNEAMGAYSDFDMTLLLEGKDK